VEVNQVTKKAYVLSYGDDTMSVIDGTSDAVTKTIRLGMHPQAIAVDEQSGRIYVANQREGSVTVVDGKTNSAVTKVKVGTIPYAIGIDAHVVYVANFSSNNVTVIR
jgi:YVTN family beta-propeller protein